MDPLHLRAVCPHHLQHFHQYVHPFTWGQYVHITYSNSTSMSTSSPEGSMSTSLTAFPPVCPPLHLRAVCPHHLQQFHQYVHLFTWGQYVHITYSISTNMSTSSPEGSMSTSLTAFPPVCPSLHLRAVCPPLLQKFHQHVNLFTLGQYVNFSTSYSTHCCFAN